MILTTAIQSSVEAHAENKAVSDYLHPSYTFQYNAYTDSTETDRPPASGLEHNEQVDQIEFEAVEEEQVVADTIQEPLLPQSDFPTDPGLYSKRSLSTRLI